MSKEFDALLAVHGQDDGGDEELKPPRKLRTRENVLAAMRWVSRNMLSGKLSGEKGLAAMRALRLLLDAISDVEPPNPEDDPAALANFRLNQAAALKPFEQRKTAVGVPATFKMRGSDDPVEKDEDGEPIKVRAVDRRSANLPNGEETEPVYRDTATVLLQDAAKAKKEEVPEW